MNPWLVGAGVAVFVSERGRQLVRQGAVHGLAAVISVGEAALAAAHDTTSEAGHAASAAGHGASRGAGAVAGAVGGIVQEAKVQARGNGKTRRKPTAVQK